MVSRQWRKWGALGHLLLGKLGFCHVDVSLTQVKQVRSMEKLLKLKDPLLISWSQIPPNSFRGLEESTSRCVRAARAGALGRAPLQPGGHMVARTSIASISSGFLAWLFCHCVKQFTDNFIEPLRRDKKWPNYWVSFFWFFFFAFQCNGEEVVLC